MLLNGNRNWNIPVYECLIRLNYHSHRLRRIIKNNDFLKDVMYKFLLLRENSLVLDQSKSFYSDKDPHYSTTCML